MVFAFVAHRVEVAHRIVELRIDDVAQRGDLRECGRQMIEQRRDPFAVVRAEDHGHHHFARRGRADDHVAHQPRMLAGIVERIAVLDAETFGLHPDVVRRVGLQPAFADVEHLVEHAGDMEPQRGRGADIRTALDLLARQPPAVGEGEFEFVAVELRPGRPQARGDFGQGDLADAGQLVVHLPGFEAQLLLVGKVLPLAAAADAEMLTEGLGAQGRFLHIADDEPLHEPAAFGAYLHIHHVARHGQRHEHHHVVPASHRLAFGGERRYFEPLDEGVICFFSCHNPDFAAKIVQAERRCKLCLQYAEAPPV